MGMPSKRYEHAAAFPKKQGKPINAACQTEKYKRRKQPGQPDIRPVAWCHAP
jgi:hypothetical protein